jgi:HK97 family phage prohead protease
MNKVFRLDSIITKVNSEGDQLRIAGYASTTNKDRVGDTILPEAWTKGGLDNYKKNPILLFNHNYSKPVGNTSEIKVDEKGLYIEALISKSAGETYGLIQDNVLRTFSVGFMIKDADYDKTNDGFIIKDAELLEVSVVSVPCNQDACFSLAKAFESKEELRKFVEDELHLEVEPSAEGAKAPEPEASTKNEEDSPPVQGKTSMNEEEIKALAEKAAQEAVEAERARVAAEKKAEEDKAAEEERIRVAAEAATKSTEERLLEQMQKTIADAVKGKDEEFEAKLKELTEGLTERAEEIKALRTSKVEFEERGGQGPAEAAIKAHMPEVEDAFLLSRVTALPGQKNWDTDFGKRVLEKVNAHSTVTVGSDALETTVGLNLEREMWNDLILAPLFREINMNSATMTIPIMPDAGYAEITANTAASGTQPNGNMDVRGAPYGAPYEGITLTDITLRTIKMIAKSYLGNETEEDAIIPILPLIREAMMRSHQRGVENMFLAGNDVDGVYTSGAVDGLIKLARTGGRMLTTAGAATPLTAAGLLSMRRAMGKYGLRPDDLVYIVSQHAYFDLMEDAEFQDADLVGQQATKLTGEVGLLYGSRVLICDEFAAPAVNKVHAIALNRRNFVVPRLRGVTVESEYQVEEQRRVLVTSQRLGFNEIMPAATSVIALKYAAA